MMFFGKIFSSIKTMVLKMKMDLWLCFGELGEGIILAAVFNYFLILPFENFPQLY